VSLTNDWIKERIEATKTAIEESEAAQASLVSGKIQHYTFNTGQTSQTVTRLDYRALTDYVQTLYARLDNLNARVCGGTVNMEPSW
jgi:hypothetical protein